MTETVEKFPTPALSVEQQIAALEQRKVEIERQVNYQIGKIDGHIEVLRERLTAEKPDA